MDELSQAHEFLQLNLKMLDQTVESDPLEKGIEAISLGRDYSLTVVFRTRAILRAEPVCFVLSVLFIKADHVDLRILSASALRKSAVFEARVMDLIEPLLGCIQLIQYEVLDHNNRTIFDPALVIIFVNKMINMIYSIPLLLCLSFSCLIFSCLILDL